MTVIPGSWAGMIPFFPTGCTAVEYGSLIYKTSGGASFPNLGTAGAYPLTVITDSTIQISPPATNYYAITDIPKTAVGDLAINTALVWEFTDLTALCAAAEAAWGGGVFSGQVAVGAGGGVYRQSDYLSLGGRIQANVTGFATHGATVGVEHRNAGMFTAQTGNFGVGPYHQYEDPQLNAWADAASCEASLITGGIVVAFYNENGTFKLYLDGVLIDTDFVGGGLYLGADPDFTVALTTVDDPSWSYIKGFAMFRRTCTPYAEAEIPDITAAYLAA